MATLQTGKATDLITFSRTSNATVTDSDGLIKWAPHNLLRVSEQFDSASWDVKTGVTITANSTAAPNSTTTADTIAFASFAYQYQRYFHGSALTGVTMTFGVWLWSATGKATIVMRLAGATTAADAATKVVTLTTTPTYHTITRTFTSTDTNADAGLDNRSSLGGDDIAGNVIAWGAHLYRSDLGGMKANTSAYPMYNPTTAKNAFGYSEDFSNAGWTKANLAAFGSGSVSNAILAPNGLQTADKVVASSSASTTRAIYQNVTPVSGSTYVVSVYAKSAEYSNLAIQDIAGGRFGASFNLVAQTATSLGGGGYVSSSITPVSDGWFRCSVTWTASGAAAVTVIGYPSGATVSAAGTSYAGDGVSGIYLWGAQLSDSASLDAYVPNYGAAPTAAAYYGPRLDYDPVTLAAKGLLVEELRANLLTYSEQFNNAAWTKSQATIVANDAAAPDGTTTADKLVDDANNTQHQMRQDPSISSGVITVSIYAKPAGRTQIHIRNGAAGISSIFNISTGTVVSQGAGHTASIVSAGNGWYRCIVSYDCGGVTPQNIIGLASSGSISYVGDGTSGAHLYGAQLEAGSFATSYIPTGAVSVTRNADVASVSTSQFPANNTEGSIVVAYNRIGIKRFSRLFTLGDAAGNYQVSGINYDVGNENSYIVAPTISSLKVAGLVPAVNTTNKLGFAFKSGDSAVSLNGAAAVADTQVFTMVNDVLALGNSLASGQHLNGHIRQITYIPRRLSNTDLTARTV